MKIEYTNFDLWKSDATELGWVHIHDDLVVCDDENDVCVGEFSSEANTGWLMQGDVAEVKE